VNRRVSPSTPTLIRPGIGHQARQLATDPAVADRVARGVHNFAGAASRGVVDDQRPSGSLRPRRDLGSESLEPSRRSRVRVSRRGASARSRNGMRQRDCQENPTTGHRRERSSPAASWLGTAHEPHRSWSC
jgi:hypothetical protein